MATEPAGRLDVAGAWRRFLEEHQSRISEMKYSLFLFRKNLLAVLGLVLILAVVVIAFIAPLLAVQQPTYVNVNGALQQRWAFHDVCLSPPANVPPNPPLILGASNVSTYVGTELGFMAVSSDPDKPIEQLNWTWSWGDGTFDTVGGTTARTNLEGHTWLAPGEYTVYVTVSDGTGNAVSGVNQVLVNVNNPPANFGFLEGTVEDVRTGNAPIAGAQLLLAPGALATATNATGGFLIAMPVGTYTVSATAYLYSPSTVSGIVVATNATTSLNLTLAPNVGWIVGSVTSTNSALLPNAQVVATDSRGLRTGTSVDAQATYNLSLTPGVYGMNATSYGYNVRSQGNVTVVAGRATQVPFVLSPLVVDCQVFLGPSSAHPFGTDNFGEDWYSKVLYGASLSLEIGLLVVIPASLIGSMLGLVAGFKGGIIEEVVMRVTDIFLSIPSLILAIAITAVLGRSIVNVTYALIITWWPWYTRLVRGQVLSLKERQFIESAKSVGASPTRLMLRHILPNSVSPVIVQASMDFGYVILTAAGLGFLGLGAPPGTAEWGVMISEGLNYLFNAPWMAVFPGLAIVLTVLGFNLLGDGLRDILDPRLRR